MKLLRRTSILWSVLLGTLIAVNIGCTGQSGNDKKEQTPVADEKKATETVDPNTPVPASQSLSEVINVTDQTFDENIKTGVALVDFWAAWCKPCRLQAPIVEEVNKTVSAQAKICKMDIDKNKVTAAKYKIESIPTLIIFKNGKVVETFVGVTEKEILVNALNKHIKK